MSFLKWIGKAVLIGLGIAIGLDLMGATKEVFAGVAVAILVGAIIYYRKVL